MNTSLPTLLREIDDSRKLAAILVVSTLAAMLDVFTIGLIFPIFLMVVRAGDNPMPAPFDLITGAQPDTETLYALGFALVGVVLFKNIALAWAMRLQTRAAAAGVIRLSRRLLRGYLTAPLEFHLERRNAQFTRGLRDLPMEIYFNGALNYCNLVAETAGVAMVVLALAALEPTGILAALILLGALVYLNHRYLGRLFQYWGRRNADLTRQIYGLIGEVFPNIKVVKTTDAECRLFGLLDRNISENAMVNDRQRFAQMAIRPLSEIAMMGAAVIILVSTLWGKDHALDAVPFLAAFTYGIFRLLPAVNRISTSANGLRHLDPLIEELRGELAATAPYLKDRAAQRLAPTIRFERELALRGVSYRYPGKTEPALSGVDLTIGFGEVVGLAGPSGAGKSTLVDIMLGLLEPTEGAVLVDGAPPRRDGLGAGAVGYVPQNSLLLDIPAQENIAFGVAPNDIDAARLAEAVTAARLEETIQGLPGGLAGAVGAQGGGLSGGQRQRFGIARALYGRPSLLILDEATSDLDTRTEFEVTTAINTLRGQTTIVLVAHRMHILKPCDKIVFLQEGRILAVGAYDELLETCPEFCELATMPEKYA